MKQVNELNREMDWTLFDPPGPLILLDREFICVKKELNVDNMLSLPDLITLKASAKALDRLYWVTVLVEQMRMIFLNFRSTSLRFGLNVYAVVRRTFR